jgi:hypothetical protein
MLLGLYTVIWVVRLLFVLFCVLFVCKYVLPPDDNPNAVNKYIIIIIPNSEKKNQRDIIVNVRIFT